MHVWPREPKIPDTSVSVAGRSPVAEQARPWLPHTELQDSDAAPRYHSGAIVGLADAETPLVRLDVGVELSVRVAVELRVWVGVADGVRVLEPAKQRAH